MHAQSEKLMLRPVGIATAVLLRLLEALLFTQHQPWTGLNSKRKFVVPGLTD